MKKQKIVDVIKVCYLTKNGTKSERAYTFGTTFPVEIGQLVEIDGNGKIGVVEEVGLPIETLEKFGDKAKNISSIYVMPQEENEQVRLEEDDDEEFSLSTVIDIDKSLIVIEQLPVISQRLVEIKGQIDKYVEEVSSLPVTLETKQKAKKARQDVRKKIEYAETLRKDIKAQIMKPYNNIEDIFESCVTDALKHADGLLKSKIDEVETAEKDNKIIEIIRYFDELKETSLLDFVKFTDIIPSGVNLSVTETAYKKQIKEWFEEKTVAYKAITALNDDIRDEVLIEFKATLNFAGAMRTVTDRRRAIAETRKEEEEKAKLIEAKKQAEKNVETALSETVSPENKIQIPIKQEEREITVVLQLTMKEYQKEWLKTYLNHNNIKYVALKAKG